ncbi:hypothetical protein MTR67_026895 [Solanum verrucosum]|uniref:Chromosome transmission fidelity protein 8 n=1 Tax=Solanum verrucosum TaxID=315347 RepID=A0AAF0R6E5_SOLVR|nr:hypothetical protein MTR67_026895 [Solanum verrucosum]
MQIQVKCSCGEEKCPEWAILELQGVVEAQPSFKDRLQNLRIGTLCRPTSQENYTFTVGYHELTGTKVPLKKPMLVLKKIKLSTEEEKGDINSTKVELDVIGVIRQRILFKTRPKALISSADLSSYYEEHNGDLKIDGKPFSSPKVQRKSLSLVNADLSYDDGCNLSYDDLITCHSHL